MKTVILRNDLELPLVGLGTWNIQKREEIQDALLQAYELNYRLIDTAAVYGNESSIGKAIRELSLDRTQLLIQDKLWTTCYGYDKAREACVRSLKKLKTDYLDVFLMHWPISASQSEEWQKWNSETWRGLESLYEEGYVKAIGVCNFEAYHVEALAKSANVMPMVNQVECHPGYTRKLLRDCCALYGMIVEASSPLGNGALLQQEPLIELANRKNRTVAQICIRWALEKGIVALPKAAKYEHIRNNIEVFDFELSEAEMAELDNMPFSGGLMANPDEVIDIGNLQ